jgi:hypothetical protein
MNCEFLGVVSAVSEGRRTALTNHWTGIQKFDEFSLPYPTMLLGGGTALWDNLKHDVCPVCHNQELEAHQYCLFCDAWGADYLLVPKTVEVQISSYVQHYVALRYGLKRKNIGQGENQRIFSKTY